MPNRLDKWKKKLSGDMRKQRYDSQKEFMVKKEAIATKDLVKIETEVKEMAQGKPLIHLPYYIIFGKEIYKRMNNYTSQTLLNEVDLIKNKWFKRGLDELLLSKIKKYYLGGDLPVVCFRLDISELDGSDTLC